MINQNQIIYFKQHGPSKKFSRHTKTDRNTETHPETQKNLTKIAHRLLIRKC